MLEVDFIVKIPLEQDFSVLGRSRVGAGEVIAQEGVGRLEIEGEFGQGHHTDGEDPLFAGQFIFHDRGFYGVKGYFADDFAQPPGVKFFKAVAGRHDGHARHLHGAGTDEDLLRRIFAEEAGRTRFGPKEDDARPAAGTVPGEQVHARFPFGVGLDLAQRYETIERLRQGVFFDRRQDESAAGVLRQPADDHAIAFPHKAEGIAAEDGLFHGKAAGRNGLEMHMVRGGSAAARAIVEEDVFRGLLGQGQHICVMPFHLLPLVPGDRNREMALEDRERIDADPIRIAVRCLPVEGQLLGADSIGA